ncbi:hypothetical protein BJY54_000792 [Streptomyces nodosus]|nr:hypothetical protein [Streptomyces nodosus]
MGDAGAPARAAVRRRDGDEKGPAVTGEHGGA